MAKKHYTIYDHETVGNKIQRFLRNESEVQPLTDRALAELLEVPLWTIHYVRRKQGIVVVHREMENRAF
jgi:16S rRNA G527 N7-methylase RsmG